MTTLRIGLIGDRNDEVPAHRAIPLALARAAQAARVRVEPVWLPTDAIDESTAFGAYAGLWCVPASPYRSMDGALHAIRYARERRVPFLGTCGGFQHAVIEYARNILGWRDADHAETATAAAVAVITPLICALVGVGGKLRFYPGTRIAAAYGATTAVETYHCSYGVNPEFEAKLVSGPLRKTAEDEEGAIRAVELNDHPFFVATLFQPERAALDERDAPLVNAYVAACANN
jgi:CTP synthase (UTP-ammonia lyase)